MTSRSGPDRPQADKLRATRTAPLKPAARKRAAKASAPKVKKSSTPATMNLRTLAEHLGLSQTTVSLVLNNTTASRSIPQATQLRVREAAAQLQYKPNYFARSLRSNRSQAIGILTPDLSEGYFTLVMNGVQRELLNAQYFYFTACHDWRPERMTKYPALLADRSVDGFLLLNTQVEIDLPVPVVAISSHLNQTGITNLCLDHERAAKIALKHLFELGHRAIAFMRGPALIPDSQYRWLGIKKAARMLGLQLIPERIVSLDEANTSPQIGYQKTQELLARRVPFTALFCFNDGTAMGAMRALEEEGMRVPEDVSVIGFDDVISASYIRPSLTTVRQPLFEMGMRGAQVLLQRIADPQLSVPSEILFEPELMIRESSGPAPRKAGRRR